MKKMQLAREIRSLLDQMLGFRISEIWYGHGTAVFFELGIITPHTQSGRASRGTGEFTIMIDCRWRLESEDRIIVGSLDDQKEKASELGKLIGTQVKTVHFVGPLPEIRIEIAENRWIQSFQDSKDLVPKDIADWGIRFPSGEWIGRAGGRIVVAERNI